MSGLSLSNKFKADDFMKILRFVYNKPLLYQTVQNSLIQHPKAPLGISTYLKTGTLAYSGVNTMVGFITHHVSGKEYAFIIMGNRHQPGAVAYKGTYTYPILEWFYRLI